jgi:hypothetical protein
MSTIDPIEQNIQGVQSLVSSKFNKLTEGASVQQEGLDGDKIDELTLDLDDAELLALANALTLKYRGYEEAIKIRQALQKQFYLGRQKDGSPNSTTLDGVHIGSNLIFEAEETFLPAALKSRPDPVVYSDNTPEGNKASKDLKTMLQHHADVLVLRRKLALTVRKWSMDFLGVMKHGWDNEIQDIKSEVKDIKNFIMDPDGYIDMYGDYIGLLGERITTTAKKLCDLFPKHKAFITIVVDGKMGSEITYTEWWSDEYCFYTFKGKVLDKFKNPNFKYEESQPGQIINHFATPKKPYSFLSVFNLGDQPHDVTGLIEQNIPNQKRITRRTEQIDYNLSRSNNSRAYSENNFNQETAKQASTAMMKGHPVLIPAGASITEAIVDFPAQPLNQAFFNELETSKQDLRSIFGTDGLGTVAPKEQKTLGGLLNNEQHDTTRIGGGVGDALEQFVDNVFNQWVQLYYVFYDETHFGVSPGNLQATDYVELSAMELNRQFVISVAPDSMKPKDDQTKMNQALTLWQEKAIDIKTLLTVLDFPDPQETAAQAWLYQTNPQMYGMMNFPELNAKIQQLMAQQQPQSPQTDPGQAEQPQVGNEQPNQVQPQPEPVQQ